MKNIIKQKGKKQMQVTPELLTQIIGELTVQVRLLEIEINNLNEKINKLEAPKKKDV